MAAAARPAACQLAHLPPGHYAAPIGTIPVGQEEHAQLVQLASHAGRAVEAAVAQERTAQLQARSDLISSLSDGHKDQTAALNDQLSDAREEVKDREGRIRELLTERHADVQRLGAIHERAITAENRDLRIQTEDNKDLRRAQLDLVTAQLNAGLWEKGFEHLGKTVGPVVPMLAARALGAPVPSAQPFGVAESGSSVADSDPPPLCWALCQLLWRVRDPDVVTALGTALRVLSVHPQLQGLGLAIMREAPEAFQAVTVVLQPTPTSAGNGAPPQQ